MGRPHQSESQSEPQEEMVLRQGPKDELHIGEEDNHELEAQQQGLFKNFLDEVLKHRSKSRLGSG